MEDDAAPRSEVCGDHGGGPVAPVRAAGQSRGQAHFRERELLLLEVLPHCGVDTAERLFKCGMQVELGYVWAPREYRSCQLGPDWDWHRSVEGLNPGSALERELERLVLREGFMLHAGGWEDQPAYFSRTRYPGVRKVCQALQAASKSHWAGFQIFYPMRENEVHGATGLDLVESMLAVFREVTPAMNLCMQIQLAEPTEPRQ